MKTKIEKIIDLIEKEIELCKGKPHPDGLCYMNDILYSLDKLVEKTPCFGDGCGNANCKHCKF